MKIKKIYNIISICLLTIVLAACGRTNSSGSIASEAMDTVYVEDLDAYLCEEVIEEIPEKAEMHIAVDLGLPSGVKWAATNVGAKNAHEFGEYFAIGGTKPYSSDYITNLPHKRGIDRYTFIITGNPSYDAATAIWGEAWKLPTDHEFYELRTQCAWIWTTEEGNDGYRIIGPNGNMIFLPIAGYKDNSSYNNIVAQNSEGYYLYGPDGEFTYGGLTGSELSASCLLISHGANMDRVGGLRGLSVRPVTYDMYEQLGMYESENKEIFKQKEFTLTKSGSIAGHEYVDLGLPSGVKWATMNINATNYFDYGGLFEWGAIYPNDSLNVKKGEILENSADTMNISHNPKYDAATAMWGETWRLPTKDDINELIENCTWEVWRKDHDKVFIATGPNNNVLVFPVYHGNRGKRLTSIWCSEPDYSGDAFRLDLTNANIHNDKYRPELNSTRKNNQLRIRPVSN